MKQKILTDALNGRNEEILHYQINIDNYTLAIAKIDAMPDDERTELADFREQLSGLLKSSLLEQKKAKIIRDVIADQLEE